MLDLLSWQFGDDFVAVNEQVLLQVGYFITSKPHLVAIPMLTTVLFTSKVKSGYLKF